jgi:hypothetical protein
VCPEGQPHPVDPGTLGEYAALLDRQGQAAAAEAFPAVAAHLAQGCAACEADLADLLAFLAAERQAAPTPGPGHLLRVVVAALIPPLSGASLGLRGTEAGPGDVRLIGTYQTGDLTVTLHRGSGAPSGGVSLGGLIVQRGWEGEELAGATAHLTAPGGVAYDAPVDALGSFGFDAVLPGSYDLELHLADQTVVLEGVLVDR